MRGRTLGTAVAHGHEQVEHALLEELRFLCVDAVQQIRGDLCMDAGDAVLDLLGRRFGGLARFLGCRAPLVWHVG